MKEKRKLSPLGVGQRVLVYDGPLRLIGAKGTVDSVCGHNDLYHIRLDEPTETADTPLIHARQCVRLKPKKAPAAPDRERVEWFEVVDENNKMQVGFGSRAHAEIMVKANPSCRVAHLVELREGERILSLADLKRAWDTVIAPSAWWGGDYSGGPHFNEMLQNLGFREEREP